MDKSIVLSEIKKFLEGYNEDLKYLVNVETNSNSGIAKCIIHEPNKPSKIIEHHYQAFLYFKDFKENNVDFYNGHSSDYIENKKLKYGIKITKLKTGNQKKLVDGYCYKITSDKSFNNIVDFLSDGGVNPYEKIKDENGRFIKNVRGSYEFKNRHLFYSVSSNEQFLISNKARLYKGYEEYKDVHKLVFDIETTGLRYEISRMFSIGVRDNRGFETILEVDKMNDDESEKKLIQDFFFVIDYLKPAIISGYNSEMFDFEYILGRAKILNLDLINIPTSLDKNIQLQRRQGVSVKYGNTLDKYTATVMWGYSVIDILHAAKKTAAVNTELKETKLKYIAKHEKIAKPNRTYIAGEDNFIGKFYNENNVFLCNEKNEYLEIPDEFQEVGKKMYVLQTNKDNFTLDEYNKFKNTYLGENKKFVEWLRNETIDRKMNIFIGGKNLVRQYLLDDLWETEQVDELYNQSSFMLSKIVPTTYQRICTMGTAAIWNLLLTAWSYENDIAIPDSDEYEHFSGGLTRCYKSGYTEDIIKIDYASLYPMIQLTYDVFPIFDITAVMKKMLLYLTTTRNIYKKLASNSEINDEEIMLLKEIEPDVYNKHINKTITPEDESSFKIKQLPIKILNNSLYGALGSNISFNWSDNFCAGRITSIGRIQLRHTISWFEKFGCIPLYAVTDGINFKIPSTTKISVKDSIVIGNCNEEGKPDDMWKYGNSIGISALINKFNKEEMVGYMSVDDDGKSISCLNLARINFASLSLIKDKKTGEMKEKIKLTGNTIKSKVLPEYIEEFIDRGLELILHGKGKEFVDYYYDYVDDIRYMQIPLRKIASKSRIKSTIKSYLNRGNDKNGRKKGMQAHMELLIREKEQIGEELFQQHKNTLQLKKNEEDLTIEEKINLIKNYMPQEPELDSVVYLVNTGYLQSHGNSTIIIDKITGEEKFSSRLIKKEDLLNNPDLKGEYNYRKYLTSFNKRVSKIFVGFEPSIAKKIVVKINKKDELIKEMFTLDQLKLTNYDLDDLNDSMYLEQEELKFWNKTGYDPKLVWNGFKEHEDNRIYTENYVETLEYLNTVMIKDGREKIKSINDNHGKGDFILLKTNNIYDIGFNNGTYVQIIRKNIKVPKTKIELEIEKKKLEEEEKIKNLEITSLDQTMSI